MTTTKDIYRIFQRFPVIATDSRNIPKDSIFFALKGESFNGNKFAAESLNKGAAYAIVDEKEYATGEKMIWVENVLETLTKLANYHRKKLNIPILAITGTNGKTTTKELVSTVLAQKFKVNATIGNLNNHIGVPLTLLRMNEKTEFGVVEMGANHPKEIDHLCQIAEPNYGIITNIGKAHLEGFGSLEGVIRTKSELFNFLKNNDGTFFYNQDNPILRKIKKGYDNCISFGTGEASFSGSQLDSPPFVHIKANFKKGVLYLNTQLTGNYNFENILAAACIGNYFEIDPLKIQEALKNYHPKNNRSQLIQRGNLTIIMDAYNANPTSMQASVKSFAANNTGQNYLILGDMLELGEYANREHQEIIELLEELNFKDAFLVGPEFCKAAKDSQFMTFNKIDELLTYWKDNTIKNGNILIKGSRGIQLEKVLEYLN